MHIGSPWSTSPRWSARFRRLGVTGQAAAALMVAFGVLVIAFPDVADVLLGAFLITTGLVQLAGSLLAVRLTDDEA